MDKHRVNVFDQKDEGDKGGGDTKLQAIQLSTCTTYTGLNYSAVCIKTHHSSVVPLSSLFLTTEGIVYFDIVLFS